MKKTFLFAVMMMVVCSIKAQLKVDSVGNVLTFADVVHNGPLTISTTKQSCIAIDRSPSDSLRRNYNIQTITDQVPFYNGSFTYTYNIYAKVNPLTSGYTTSTCYGLYSEILGTGTNRRYGVFSKITNNGIAVCGSTSSVLPVPTASYAGYFNGLTHVEGNLSVSGNISGVLLSKSASSSSTNTISDEMAEQEKAVLPIRLQRLTTHKIQINTPKQLFVLANDNESNELEEEVVEVNPEPSSMEKQILTKQHYGLDADQLEEVFPDLVYENEDGTKSINYVEMVPILVQAINELSAKVETLEGSNTAKKVVTRGTANVDGTEENVVLLSLGQNKPNPFGTTTSIEVSIPEVVQKAFIYVYDLQGKKVDQVDITARGKQTIQVNAGNLSDGMYLYSLIADGKVVETRRMIVEK